MIVVKLELWPGGDESRAEDLGSAIITNESNLSDISSYSVRLLKGKRYSARSGVWRSGEVKGFPRTDTRVGPWELLFLALESALGKRVDLIRRIVTQKAEGAPVIRRPK